MMSTIKKLTHGDVVWCEVQALVYDASDGNALYLDGEGSTNEEPGRRHTLDGEVVGFGEPGGLVSPLRVMMTGRREVVVDASMVDDDELREELLELEDTPLGNRRFDLMRVHKLVGTGEKVDEQIESEEDLAGFGELAKESGDNPAGGASLPEHLHQHLVQNILPGETVWCIPWLLSYDASDGNALYLDGDYNAHATYPGGTASLRVQRLEDGKLVVDAKKVDDEELLDDVGRLQSKEDAAALMRVDEIRGTVWARDGRYEPKVSL